MDRREFSIALALAAALSPLSTRAAAGEPQVSARARALYGRSLILDCNSGPPTQDSLPLPHADLELVRHSGVNVLKWSLGGINSNFADTVAEVAGVQQLVEVHPGYFMQVRVSSDLERAKRENKLGLILSFESAEMFNGKLESLEVFRDLGVRVMQLSYNRKSPFAAGVLEPDGGGLTALGRDAVAHMNKLGVAIDVSHANAATTADVLALSGKPVLMTHAGSAVIHPHPRNKSDEQLRALAAKGGVVGIFDLPYLTPSPRQPNVDDYMQHLEHVLKVVGEDHVGIGSDVGLEPFDTGPQGMAEFKKEEDERRNTGLAAPEEDRPTFVEGLNTPRRLEVIADQLLKRGYSEAATQKVLGANFARVFGQIWGS